MIKKNYKYIIKLWHRFSIYEKYKTNLPKTEYVTDNEITLPMYYNLSKDEIKYISKSLQKI